MENIIVKKLNQLLDEMIANPNKVTDSDRDKLNSLYSKLCKALGISEHSQWRVEWRVEKWLDTAKKLAGIAPDEVSFATQNIILDGGANEMLKLITGTGGTAYSNGNARIFVGTNSTTENSAQTGVLASGSSVASAVMESGYPVVSDRQAVFRASFGDDSANFAWNELAISNGNGAGAVALNRKVDSLGTKVTGTWTLQITVSVTSE